MSSTYDFPSEREIQPTTPAQPVGMLGRENDAFHRALRKYPDAFEALHSFWNDAIASQPSPAATVTDGSIREGDVLSYTMDDGVGKVTAHVRPHSGSSADTVPARETVARILAHKMPSLRMANDTPGNYAHSIADEIVAALTNEPQEVPDRQKVIDLIGYHFAALVSGNNQPHMSGDPRARLLPHVRRRFDGACETAADAILALSRPAPQAAPKLSDFAELKLLIDEYDPENSDWNFRRGVLLDILVRVWPTSSQVTRPQSGSGL